ncbi:MAG: hypothetical protein LBG77_07990 [Dysgonamonadaceae bacterium]|nr:hypothetical protein [Dysgonamonadaceae bacterium]
MLTLFAACGGNDDKTKADQTITFDNLPPHNLSEGSFELTASASSGLPLAFTSSNVSVATVSGKTVNLLSAGTTLITASQSGDDSWFEAPKKTQILTVNEDNNPNKKTQTITFALSVTEYKYGDEPLSLNATADSGLPVTFSCNSQFVKITDNRVELLYTGAHYENEPVEIVASQSGNDEYNAAPNVTRTLRITHVN